MEGLIFGILRYFQVRFVLIIIIIVVCKLKDYICYALMLSYFVFEGKYIRRGDLTEGFLRYEFGGLIFGGAHTWRAYFRNFTV